MSRLQSLAPNFTLVSPSSDAGVSARRRSAFRMGLVIAGLGALLAIPTRYITHDVLEGLPTAGEFQHYQEPMPSTVWTGNNTSVYSYTPDLREPVPLADVPQDLIHALTVTQDPGFFNKPIPVWSDIPSLWDKLVDWFEAGITIETVSSPIERAVLNRLVPLRAPSITNSLKYTVLSTRINQGLSRPAIMGLYINQASLGHHTIGFQAAAHAYYKRDLKRLRLDQLALLTAMLTSPDDLSAIDRADEALAARDAVLRAMAAAHVITKDALNQALHQPLDIQEPSYPVYDSTNGYFIEEVYHEVATIFGASPDHGLSNVATGGLNIHTTLDAQLQKSAQDALATGLLNFDNSAPRRTILGHITLDPAHWREQAQGIAPWLTYRDWRIGLVLTNNRYGTMLGFPDGTTGTLLDGHEHVSPGHIIAVAPTGYRTWSLRTPPAISGAIVVENPKTGRVLAMAGGFDYGLDRLNRAVDLPHAPGSAISPFVYAAALDHGLEPNSLLSNTSFCVTANIVVSEACFRNDKSQTAAGYHTLRWGLEADQAVMTARIAQKIGIDSVVTTLGHLGLGPYHALYPYAQGSGPTNLATLTNAYATLANGGFLPAAHLVDYITDRHGNVIWKAPVAKPTPALDPRTAYQLIDILHSATQRGPASPVDGLTPNLFGKAGVSLGNKAAWFAGGTPDIVAGVYLGFDKPRSLTFHPNYQQAAIPIFTQFMRDNPAFLTSKPFAVPTKVTFKNVVRATGRVLPGPVHPASSPQSAIIPEVFKL